MLQHNLLTQMKMANVINNDQLDKSIHSLDLVDAMRLNLLFYRLRNVAVHINS